MDDFVYMGDCRVCGWYNWDNNGLCNALDGGDPGEEKSPDNGCNHCDHEEERIRWQEERADAYYRSLEP